MHNYTLNDQLELEKSYREYAKELFTSRHKAQEEKGRAGLSPVGQGLTNYYADLLAKNVEAWLDNELKPRRGVQKEYKKLLEYLVDKVGREQFVIMACAFTFSSILNAVTLNARRLTLSSINLHIGRGIYREIRLNDYLESIDKASRKAHVEHEIKTRVKARYKLAYENEITKEHSFYKSDKLTREQQTLGASLVTIFIEVTGLVEKDQLETERTERLVATERMVKMWQVNTENMATRANYHVPTIIPPRPWSGMFDGGYYGEMTDDTAFIRIASVYRKTRTIKNYLHQLENTDLTPIYNAVNLIQSTPYKINTAVLDLVQTIVNNGGGYGGVERLEPYEKLPWLENGSVEEVKAHKKKAQDLIKKEIARRSKALRVLKIFNLAKDFSKYPRIYFPCNIDFRGRIYPISFFNHQGDDFMKSFIIYADPVACKAETDLDLLRIQGCNLWGNDKVSLQERIEWVLNNEQNILACATEPTVHTWWHEADEPLQFVAWCMEYKKAVEYLALNGSIIGFKCGVPISYDGTCSGLQHYSAMLQDPIGGSAVNLVDHERPYDIYQDVADKVIKTVEYDLKHGSTDELVEYEDGKTGTKYGKKTLAEMWFAHGINRKVCKRPVMTLAYGSAEYGFSEQLYEDFTKDSEIFATKSMKKQGARYLAKHIWKAVQQVVTVATQGMDYLKDLASELAKDGFPVMWFTPLGFPVLQPYLKVNKVAYQARLGAKIRVRLYYDEPTDREDIDPVHQRSGIAPNFIHSLDSTHLMMVVNSAGLRNYTTIHDSFGTSLGEASTLKVVIREQLYKLYTEYRPLESFKEYVEFQLKRPLDIEPPEKGSLDLKNILTSTFIFH